MVIKHSDCHLESDGTEASLVKLVSKLIDTKENCKIDKINNSKHRIVAKNFRNRAVSISVDCESNGRCVKYTLTGKCEISVDLGTDKCPPGSYDERSRSLEIEQDDSEIKGHDQISLKTRAEFTEGGNPPFRAIELSPIVELDV